LNGILYNKGKTTIIYAPHKVDYSKVTFPETVTTIGKGAFEGATFEEIEIPANVTTIETAAFEGCANLKRVKIPATVTDIGEGAFAGCHESFYIDAPADSYAYEYAEANGLLPNIFLGDVTGDGKVGAIDARWILQYVAAMRPFTADQFKAADINGDGKVSALDVRLALQLASS
jgi:hypothetical protein